MDLCQQRRVHQPRVFEKLVVIPQWVRQPERIADRVVLQREEGEQHLESNPPPGDRGKRAPSHFLVEPCATPIE